ncbi:hypothetical protein GRN71_003395 [Salmonella enterica subsp. enterica serovar Thompson]|nr:hypothetical protein [Salmonella enterica subsp. enterica serovar Thompson]
MINIDKLNDHELVDLKKDIERELKRRADGPKVTTYYVVSCITDAQHFTDMDCALRCLKDVTEDLMEWVAELERSETQLINERDAAESALNDAYKAVMGQAPEWSNWFSFENAIDEIELACEQWRNQTDDVIQFRQRIQELEAKLETADRLQDGAFRDGLKAGFSYGQTDDQSGYEQCLKSYSSRGKDNG